MYYAYILQSLKDKRTYAGFCENVEKRLLAHNSGEVNATKNRRPFKILLIEEFNTIKEAKNREKYWKSGSGRRRLKQLFKREFPPTTPLQEAGGEARPSATSGRGGDSPYPLQ